MRIQLLAVGTRMPEWIDTGYRDYARRLPPEWGFVLKEISVSKSGSRSPRPRREAECERLMAALPRNSRVIVLDMRGALLSTEELAAWVGEWQMSGRDVTLVVGGADGLAPACIARADELWSLSRLTLPHGLVRVIVIEQLYRAWTMLRGHPYHRA